MNLWKLAHDEWLRKYVQLTCNLSSLTNWIMYCVTLNIEKQNKYIYASHDFFDVLNYIWCGIGDFILFIKKKQNLEFVSTCLIWSQDWNGTKG